MNKKNILRKWVYLLLVMLICPTMIFAADYTQADMDNRLTTIIDGVEYINYGEPVVGHSWQGGLFISENYIDSEGVPHNIENESTADLRALNFNEKGETGNVKEADNITLEDGTMPADNSNVMTVDSKVNLVLPTDGGFNTPRGTIAVYIGDIMNKQDYVNWMNTQQMYHSDLPEGQTEWTVESWIKYAESNNKDPWQYGGTIMSDEQFSIEIIVKSVFDPVAGQFVYEFNIDGTIYCIKAFGADEESMKALYDKLYRIIGDEMIDLNDPDNDDPDDDDPDDDDPDDDGPGGGDPAGGGPWSDIGPASVSANVWSEKYNVSHAIPTSEYLNGSISASDMSWYYNIKRQDDSIEYTFDAELSWDWWEGWVDVTETVNGKEVVVDRYWWEGYTQFDTARVTGSFSTHYFVVDKAWMNTLSGGSVTNPLTGVLASLGAVDLAGSIDKTGGLKFDLEKLKPDTPVAGSDYDSRDGALAAAISAANERVRLATIAQNDTLTIKSTVLWGKTDPGKEFGATPYDGPFSHLVSPSSSTISNSSVNEKIIPSDKANGTYPSSASASYPIKGGFDGKNPNDNKGAGAPSVHVHTPVVNNTTITVEPFINQKVTKESGLTYLQLDKTFTIDIPDSGTHISAQGYESRDYNSYQAVPQKITNWGKIKDVKVPFDAYLQPSNTLIKAGTWISDYGLATAQNSYTFLVPVWSKEDKGTIETRVVAENIPSYGSGTSAPTGLLQEGANLDSTKYIAEKKIPVEVVGKIYDLRISGTNDPGWPGITGKGGAYVASPEFPFGQSGQNSLKTYKFAPKLGYVVEFDFKTKGVKTDNVDVSVQPEGFYFISKNGGNSEKVDLYFKTKTAQYVKIEPGVNDSNTDIIVNLSNPFMKVARSEIIDSTKIMRQQIGVLYTYAENVLIGKLPSLNIPEKLRLCYNNFAEYSNKLYGKPEESISNDANGGLSYSTGKYDKVNNGRDTVIASVGHWYAGYRLPATTIAVPVGTTPRQIVDNPNIAKKNGYILVKFDIVGKNGDEDYLRYTGPESITEPGQYDKNPDGSDKQWQDPGPDNPDRTNPEQPVKLPNDKPGKVPDGTVILFETDMRANDDYQGQGTH